MILRCYTVMAYEVARFGQQRVHRFGNFISVPFLGLCLLGCMAMPAQAQSLYQEDTYKPLASDRKAFRTGDLITVQIVEQSSASSSTDTSTQRNNSMSASLALQPSGKLKSGALAVGGSFDGGGTTQRANRLLATLSVNVVAVLPNGDLKISGEQLLTINNEKHKVLLEGRIRPQDISSDNMVLSTRLADAKIDYRGDGDLSSRQRPSWWRRLLDAVGL